MSHRILVDNELRDVEEKIAALKRRRCNLIGGHVWVFVIPPRRTVDAAGQTVKCQNCETLGRVSIETRSA